MKIKLNRKKFNEIFGIKMPRIYFRYQKKISKMRKQKDQIENKIDLYRLLSDEVYKKELEKQAKK